MAISDVSELKVDVLPAGFIIKDVIGDFEHKPVYNYEDWLRELVNESSAFMARTGGVKFEAPDQEAHGEADAITDSYSLDFKLAAGNTMMHALRETSWQKIVDAEATITTKSRRNTSMRGVKLYAALRQQSMSDLKELWSVNPTRDRVDEAKREVVGFLKLLKVKKNLLVLFPSVLYTEGGVEYSLAQVSDAVYSDFALALELRREQNPGYDSYFAFIMDQHLVIVESRQDGWSPFDRIPLTSSETFKEIAWRYVPFTSAWLNELVGIRSSSF